LVRLHAGLVVIVAAFGLYFLLDPCGGGSDLCLGGVVALVALTYAGIGIGSIITWRLGHRASPLLVWDSVLVTLAGATLLVSMAGGLLIVILGIVAMLVLGVPGAILSGRAVSRHKVERLLALAALAATILLGDAFIAVVVVGLVALAIGWLLGRRPAAAHVAIEADPGS
jgi:hypothetical protein